MQVLMSSILQDKYCSVSHHICNTLGVHFLVFMTIIRIYCFIHVFCRKNNLRIFRGSKYQTIKNIEDQKKIKYSFKKKSMALINTICTLFTPRPLEHQLININQQQVLLLTMKTLMILRLLVNPRNLRPVQCLQSEQHKNPL